MFSNESFLKDESKDVFYSPYLAYFAIISLYLIMISTFILNLLSIVCILVAKAYSTINLLIISLALSDILYAFGIPIFTQKFLHTEVALGKLTYQLSYLFDMIALMGNVYTVAALTLERYLFLNQYRLESNLANRDSPKIPFLLLISWVFAFSFALPKTLAIDRKTIGSMECVLNWNESTQKLYSLLEFVLAFGIPFLVVIVFSIKIFIFVERWPKNTNSFQRIIRKRTRIFIITVVITFCITWLPFWIFQISDHFVEQDSYYVQAWNKVVLIINYSNGIINPLLYMLLTNNFRDYFEKLVQKTKRLCIVFKYSTSNEHNYQVVISYMNNLSSTITRKSFLTSSIVKSAPPSACPSMNNINLANNYTNQTNNNLLRVPLKNSI